MTASNQWSKFSALFRRVFAGHGYALTKPGARYCVECSGAELIALRNAFVAMEDGPVGEHTLLLAACKRAVPWLALVINERVNDRCVSPNSAVETLNMLQQAIAESEASA